MNQFLRSFGSTVGAGATVIFVGLFSVMVLIASCGGDGLSKDDVATMIAAGKEATATPQTATPTTAATATAQATANATATPARLAQTGGKINSGATITNVATKFQQEQWQVTMYGGRTDRIENWFHQLKDLNPQDCLLFPNVDNACTSGFKASYGMQYGKYIDIYCQTADPCKFVNSPSSIRYFSGDYDIGFDSCAKASNNGNGCLFIDVNVGEKAETFLDFMGHQGFTLTGVFFDSNFMDLTLYGVGSHVAARMLNLAKSDSGVNDGGNCSYIGGCPGVRTAIAVTSGNELVALAVETVDKSGAIQTK